MIAPLIFSGPSGVGKTYLEKFLIHNYNCKRILSTTTRTQRANEQNGVDYEFITDKEFSQLQRSGAFVTALENLNAFYGIRRELVGAIIKENKIPVCVIVPQILHTFSEAFPDTVALFLKPVDTSLLTKRMRLRGDSDEVIDRRLKQTLVELEYYDKLNYLYKKSITVTDTNFEQVVTAIKECYKQSTGVSL